MSQETFDPKQMSAIKVAADRVVVSLGARKEKDKLVVRRAVFDIAAETNTFDPDKLVQMAQERLTANLGWRFT